MSTDSADNFHKEWGNIRISRPVSWARSENKNYFQIGLIIFLSVALVYPWYAYKVNDYLMSRDLQATIANMEREGAAAAKQASLQAAKSKAAFEAADLQQRLSQVRIKGIAGQDPPVVLVELGRASLEEAESIVCRQAAAWLRTSTSGRVLRVQRFRGSQPALEAGELACR